MKYILLISSLLLLINGSLRAQSVPVIKLDQLQATLNNRSDTLYIVNFWATWCGPCVQEMPYLETARKHYSTEKVKFLLVSMDDRDQLKTKVIPFVKSRNIGSSVVLLDEPDASAWIDKVAPEWSGALPMTLVINKTRNIRQFIGKPLKEGELESILKTYNL